MFNKSKREYSSVIQGQGSRTTREEKGREFRREARDQIKRYVDPFRRVQKHPAMKCKGIGIIAREISQQTINRVKTYFDKNEMEGRLFIGLVDPLIELLLAVQ